MEMIHPDYLSFEKLHYYCIKGLIIFNNVYIYSIY